MISLSTLRRTAALFAAVTAVLGAAGCGLGGQTGTVRTVTAAEVAATTTAPTTTTTTSPPAAAVAPNQTVIVVPQGAPSTVTQYETLPPVYSPSSGSYSDADFLARLNARGIVTPSAATRTAGGQNVCYQLATGSTLTTEANRLLSSPYNYWNELAGFFVGEAVKVYCPQYRYMLTS